MDYRTLGNSNMQFSRLGLGTWAFGGSQWSYGWAGQNDQDSINTIHEAIDQGINWLDTAAAYGYGYAEEITGKALKGKRDKVFIATKGGLKTAADGWNFECVLKAQSLRKEAEDSLLRLQTDVIDLYQIHKPFPDEDIEEGWAVVADLIKEGKVRYGGVSIFSIEQMQRCQRIHPITSYQPPYSMFVRGIEKELLDFCQTNQIGVITYSPLRSGLLSGKLTAERLQAMEKEDWRTHADPEFQGKRLSINLDAVEQLRQVAAAMNVPLAELAIAWVLRSPAVTGTIIGARRPQQFQANLPAVNIKLSKPQLDKIEEILAARARALQNAGEPLDLPW